MSMELAYNLVTGKTPFDAKKVLDDVIVLLCPTHNPDGNQMVVDWYKKYVGTKYEGGGMPWLYHYYAGHDNNRDWYMLQPGRDEGRDQGPLPRLAAPDPPRRAPAGLERRPPLHPALHGPAPAQRPAARLAARSTSLGTAMAYDLQQNGKSGVVNGRSYTAWYIGACDDTPWLHNVVGILSEAASVRLATPIYIEPTEIPKSYAEKMMDFVDPWPGGWWRLRDIVDYELIMTQSLIKTAALHKEDLLLNFYQMCKDSIEKIEKDQPYAFVIPAKQHDYPTMLKMLEVLQMGGVEIQQAKADFVADGKFYPAGSFVVKMAQPYKAFAWAMLEKQKYPDMRQYPGGPPAAALRQRRLDAAAPDGRRLRARSRSRSRPSSRRSPRSPIPPFRPARAAAISSSWARRSTPPIRSPSPSSRTPRPRSGGRRPRSTARASTSRPGASSSRTRPRSRRPCRPSRISTT